MYNASFRPNAADASNIVSNMLNLPSTRPLCAPDARQATLWEELCFGLAGLGAISAMDDTDIEFSAGDAGLLANFSPNNVLSIPVSVGGR